MHRDFGGVVVLRIWPGEPGTEAPILAYWACSISNAIGPACGMLALKYISYPAQVRYPAHLLDLRKLGHPLAFKQ